MIFKFKAGSDAWLQTRQEYIMATEVAPMFGLNPYTSIAEVFRNKVKPDRLNNKFLRAGQIYESSVIKALEVDLGWDVGYLDHIGESSFIFANPEYKLAATPDAWRWDVAAIVEAKTTGSEKFERYWRTGHPPLWYLSQVQAQLFATNMQTAYLVCMALTPDPPIAVYELQRNEEFVNRMKELAVEYWGKWERGDAIRASTKDKKFATDALMETTKLVHITEPESLFTPSSSSLDFLFQG